MLGLGSVRLKYQRQQQQQINISLRFWLFMSNLEDKECLFPFSLDYFSNVFVSNTKSTCVNFWKSKALSNSTQSHRDREYKLQSWAGWT